VSDAVAAAMVANPGGYQVRITGMAPVGGATFIGGRLDGQAWGPVGERTETDPFYAEKVCQVAIAP